MLDLQSQGCHSPRGLGLSSKSWNLTLSLLDLLGLLFLLLLQRLDAAVIVVEVLVVSLDDAIGERGLAFLRGFESEDAGGEAGDLINLHIALTSLCCLGPLAGFEGLDACGR